MRQSTNVADDFKVTVTTPFDELPYEDDGSEALALLVLECRYVGERMQQSTMTSDEAKAFLAPRVKAYVAAYHTDSEP